MYNKTPWLLYARGEFLEYLVKKIEITQTNNTKSDINLKNLSPLHTATNVREALSWLRIYATRNGYKGEVEYELKRFQTGHLNVA